MAEHHHVCGDFNKTMSLISWHATFHNFYSVFLFFNHTTVHDALYMYIADTIVVWAYFRDMLTTTNAG